MNYTIVILIALIVLLCINQTEGYSQYKVYGQRPFTAIPNTMYRAWEYLFYPAYRGIGSSFLFVGNPPAKNNINWFGSCDCKNGRVKSDQCNQGQAVCNGDQCMCGFNTEYGCDGMAQTFCS